jgi:hypothetical protein
MQKLRFGYRGHVISFNGTDSRADDELTMERLKSLIDGYWEELSLEQAARGSAINVCRFEERLQGVMPKGDMLEVLRALDIISISREDTWEIMCDNTSLNPRSDTLLLFFRRQVDAIGYAKMKYLDSPLSWQIVHHDKVLRLKDIVAPVPA